MSDICQLLKSTRLSRGLTLEEVAQRTYIKLHYLEALEEGHLDRLPAPVHTYGYIRQYAKLLGLDGSALVAQFQQDERHGGGLAGAPNSSGPLRGPAMPAFSGESFSPFKRSNGTPSGNGGNGHSNGHANGHTNGHTNGQEGSHGALVANRNGSATTGQSAGSAAAYLAVDGEPSDLRSAKLEAQQILTSAEREAQQLVRGAAEYADEVLSALEAEIGKTLQIVRNGRQFLQTRREPGSSGY